MTEETNDKALFRNTRYSPAQSPTLPSSLRWAVGDDQYITGGVGGGKSTVGSIVFAPDFDGTETVVVPPTPGEDEYQPPRVPTPVIMGVASSEVYQTMEGLSKSDVYIEVNGMEGVEYEVVVTKA